MKNIIYTCNSCGKDYPEEDFNNIITICSSRRDSHLDVYTGDIHIKLLEDYGELHFCSKDCIEQFFRNIARDIWDAKYPVICKYDGKSCDYEGPEGKGYCEGCARE